MSALNKNIIVFQMERKISNKTGMDNPIPIQQTGEFKVLAGHMLLHEQMKIAEIGLGSYINDVNENCMKQ